MNQNAISKVIVAASIVLSLSGCSADVSPVSAAGPTGVKNIILVHGAWSDGSSWSKVVPLLQADGYGVVAVQLPLTSLADDVAAVQRAIALETGPVVLAGHSYGGDVISVAGNDPKVEGLVYLAAYAPDQGESALSLGKTVPATPIMADISLDAGGYLKLSATGLANDFAQDLTPVQQATMAATQGPVNAPNALGFPLSAAPAWKKLPSWYMIATNDRVIGTALEQQMATKIKATITSVSSSHAVMLAQPEATTQFIEKAAASLAP